MTLKQTKTPMIVLLTRAHFYLAGCALTRIAAIT